MKRLRDAWYPHWSDERAHGLQKVLPWYGYKWPQQFAVLSAVAGAWFLILTAILLGYHRGEAWAWLLVPAAVLSLFCAWYIPRAVAAVTGSNNAS